MDIKRLLYRGKLPNLVCCDSMLRVLPNGDWALFMLSGGETEPRKENGVFISKSIDKGETWDEPSRLNIKFNSAIVPTEVIVCDNKITLYISTHEGGLVNWDSCYCESFDSGETWSELKLIPFKNDKTFIRNLFIRENGQWILPYQHYILTDKTKRNRLSEYHYTTIYENGVFMSNDKGETWTCNTTPSILNDSVELKFNYHENNVTELSDNTLVMLIRVDKTGYLYRSDSSDGGVSWSKPIITDIPNPGSKFRLFKISDGRIILIHNPNNKITKQKVFSSMCRNPLSIWISDDDMKSWSIKRDLVDFPGQLAYPDGFVDDKEEYVHFAFDYNRHDVIYVGAKI